MTYTMVWMMVSAKMPKVALAMAATIEINLVDWYVASRHLSVIAVTLLIVSPGDKL
jgi:hypothetical protein